MWKGGRGRGRGQVEWGRVVGVEGEEQGVQWMVVVGYSQGCGVDWRCCMV